MPVRFLKVISWTGSQFKITPGVSIDGKLYIVLLFRMYGDKYQPIYCKDQSLYSGNSNNTDSMNYKKSVH